MYKYIIRLIEKILDIHICTEHTQWEDKQGNFSRPIQYDDLIVDWEATTITYTKKWQERHCTICGKKQQRRIKY